jgi:hypothetical protein
MPPRRWEAERGLALADQRDDQAAATTESRQHIGRVSEVPRQPYTVAAGRLKGATFHPKDYVAGCTCGWHGEIRSMVGKAREDRDTHLRVGAS